MKNLKARKLIAKQAVARFNQFLDDKVPMFLHGGSKLIVSTILRKCYIICGKRLVKSILCKWLAQMPKRFPNLIRLRKY